MKKTNGWMGVALAAGMAVLAAGCVGTEYRRTQHRANSLYKFLYPAGTEHIDTPSIPTLSLPLRVGVAFVPNDEGKGHYYDAQFSETQKAALMKKVSAEFTSYPFVKSIEIIPSAYLTPRGGFENIDQLRTLYNLDVIALLSYDQTQFTDQGLLSFTYWTIVGAYVFPGEKNDTRTMLDGAVYDIASRKLLFRAPGISVVKGKATLVNQTEELRANGETGFEMAATNMVVELKAQLAQFQERVKNSPTEYKVTHRPGYTGAGALGGAELALLGCAGVCLAVAERKSRK